MYIANVVWQVNGLTTSTKGWLLYIMNIFMIALGGAVAILLYSLCLYPAHFHCRRSWVKQVNALWSKELVCTSRLKYMQDHLQVLLQISGQLSLTHVVHMFGLSGQFAPEIRTNMLEGTTMSLPIFGQHAILEERLIQYSCGWWWGDLLQRSGVRHIFTPMGLEWI